MTQSETALVFGVLGFLLGYGIRAVLARRTRKQAVIPSISKLDYKPGDYVMISYAGWLTKEQRTALSNKIAATFPPESSITAVVLEGGVKLETFATAPEDKDRRRPVGQGKPVDWEDDISPSHVEPTRPWSEEEIEGPQPSPHIEPSTPWPKK